MLDQLKKEVTAEKSYYQVLGVEEGCCDQLVLLRALKNRLLQVRASKPAEEQAVCALAVKVRT